MQKLEQIYEGKAKKVFKTDDPELLIVDYKDDATAFNGLKKGTILGKGVINNQMTNRQITDLHQLVPGRYGLLEPAADAPVIPVDAIDFAVLPCVTCNYLGQRLGHGGGYYDRFLSQYRGGTVLLCRELLIRQEIPVEPHDYPVPWVLTERGLYEDGIPAPLG